MSKYLSPLTGCKPDARSQLLASLPSDLTLPAQKPAPVPGGSGAGLVGNPPHIVLNCQSDFGAFDYVCHLNDYPRWKRDLGDVIKGAQLVGSLV